MAISTYSELKTAIQTWLHRGDITAANCADFITLAESKLNRKLRLRSMDEITDQTTSVVSRELAFPTSTVEIMDISIVLEDDYQQALTFISPELMPPLVSPVAAQPNFYTIRDVIEFECVSDQAYTIKTHYLKGFALSDSEPTNWLLTNHPDVYLFGALVEASPFIGADARFAMWAARFEGALNEINAKEARSKTGPLVTDVPRTMRDYVFDIVRGV